MAQGIERLIRIYNRLRRGPVTIDIIKKWTKSAGIEVSARQLYRDLNKLKNSKFAEGENVVEYVDEKNRKTWKLEYDEQINKVSQYDINSFFLFKNFLPASIQNARSISIEKFEKILYQQLSRNKYQQLIEANELFLKKTNYYDSLYTEIEHNQIEEIIWALHNKRVIILQSIGINPSNVHAASLHFPLPLHPMELLFHKGRVHLAAMNFKNELQIFTIDKSLHFELSNDVFNRKKFVKNFREQLDKRFGISKPINEKIYKIKVEFTKGYGESMMKFFWHHSQQWKPLKNGNYMLHLECTIGRELIGFLAQGLDKIKIHQPKILRDFIIKKMGDTVLIHQNNLGIDEERANEGY